MHPAASNRAPIRRRSFATSLPGARLARTRWSGPRGCRAGSGPETFPAWSPADHGGGALSLDVGLWDLLWRSLVFIIGIVLVIPSPWVATWFYRWIVSRLYVPGRPNLAFTGQPLDIWYVLIAIGILT